MVAPAGDPPTAGLILAGGLSRRMGGGDKPLLALGGTAIVERVIARLRPQVDHLILNANGDPGRFDGYRLPVVPDEVPGFAGPLAGVLAGLDWVAAHRPHIEWVASVAADTPFLPRDLVARLHRARRAAGLPLACAWSSGRAHPVNALWPVSLRDDLRRAVVREGERKIDRWTGRHGVAHASWEDGPPDPFFNVNRPEDFAEAERLLAAAEGYR